MICCQKCSKPGAFYAKTLRAWVCPACAAYLWARNAVPARPIYNPPHWTERMEER